MIYVKWFIYPPGQERPIALRFSYMDELGHIGGSYGDYDIITGIMTDFFHIRVGRKKVISNNKIRFIIKLTKRRFNKALDKLDKDGFVINKTSTHNRIMR